jgi:hypothetical protein
LPQRRLCRQPFREKIKMKKMKILPHLSRLSGLLLAAALTLSGCASTPSTGGWVTLLEGGKGLENFVQQGDANWRVDEQRQGRVSGDQKFLQGF